MFVDKSAPSTVTVARVSRFFSAPGVKNSDTLATVDSSYMPQPPKVYPDGYVVELQSETGTWYYSKSLLGWTEEIGKSYIFARYSEKATAERAEEIYHDLVAVFGLAAIISVRHRPIRNVPIGRCEIIEEQP